MLPVKVVVVKVDKVNNCTDNLEISALKPTRCVLSSTFQEDFCCDLLDIIRRWALAGILTSHSNIQYNYNRKFTCSSFHHGSFSA